MVYRRGVARRPRRQVRRRVQRRPRRQFRRVARRPMARYRHRRIGGGRGFGRGFGRRSQFRKRAPMFMTTGSDVIIHNTEYLFDLVSAPASLTSLSPFTSQQIQVNPANAIFPFLSQVSSCFEEFQFLSLQFIIKSTSSSALNSVNTALGSVGISSFYNAGAGTINPQSKIQVEAMQGAVSGSPAKSHVHHVQVRGHSKNPLSTLYVGNPNGTPAGSDGRFFNVCDTYIWSQGLQNSLASNLGEVFVKYSIRLKRPRVFATQFNYNSLTSKYEYANPNTTTVASATTLSNRNMFGAPTITPTTAALGAGVYAPSKLLTANVNNMQPLTFAFDGTNSGIAFPSTTLFGNYLVSYTYQSFLPFGDFTNAMTLVTSTSQTTGSPLVSQGVSGPLIFANGTSSFMFNQNTSSAPGYTTYQMAFSSGININTTSNVPAQAVFSGSNTFASTTPYYVDLMVVPFNGFINSWA
jgi:hypothetical protein